VALVLCTAANTALHRRYTFARRGEPRRRNILLGGMAALLTSVAVTSMALVVVAAVGIRVWWLLAPVLVLANAIAAFVRFVLLRSWMFRTSPAPRVPDSGARRPVSPEPPGTSHPTTALSDGAASVPRPVVLNERQTG
jgi:hypothetical protein